MSSPGEMLEESGIKRARKDVFFGGKSLKQNRLAPCLCATPPTTLIGNPANPSISSSWSAKAFDTILSSRPAVPRIDASPAPLLLPGVHRDIALVDGVNPLSFDRIQLPDVNQNSFVLTSSNAAIASPASEAIQNSLAIPIVNLSEVLATLSAEKGLSDVAKGRLEWLRSLLDQGRTARAEKVMVPLKHGSEEVFRRVGPHLVPAGKDLIPVSAGDHHQLPVVVEDYLATLRAETPVILPSKDENGLVEVVATPTELSESLAGATLAPGTQLFPSRFCPNRREGPILSLIANLPTNDMAEHSHESGHGDELLDPLSWGHGDLEQEFGKWLKGEAKRENEEGGRQVRKGGSFLQLDIEVVGARLVTLNDTL
ncbi:hypothetical protein BC829DRAFT_380587 [Chytridium lagenaria]|nr:hypothetical protein BC829DRAFT_380587 [Chytridium lagenaria]